MTISSLLEEPAFVDADGLGERGRRRHDPPDDELPPVPPAGAENQDFLASLELERLRKEEGLGEEVWMCIAKARLI